MLNVIPCNETITEKYYTEWLITILFRQWSEIGGI